MSGSSDDDPLLIQGFLEDVYTIWTDENHLLFLPVQDGLRSTDNGDHWVEMSNFHLQLIFRY